MSKILQPFTAPSTPDLVQEKLSQLEDLIKEAVNWTVEDSDGEEK
jgi:hypothetical protein